MKKIVLLAMILLSTASFSVSANSILPFNAQEQVQTVGSHYHSYEVWVWCSRICPRSYHTTLSDGATFQGYLVRVVDSNKGLYSGYRYYEA